VTDAPETHYTRSADGTNVAYRVRGDDPVQLVFPDLLYPIALLSEASGFIRLRWRLDTFSRTVSFNARGRGASEGDPKEAMIST
jgi:hypothetical protein